jgi:hypothetical protein
MLWVQITVKFSHLLRTMDWMRAVIILAMKTRIGSICISNTWDVKKRAPNLGHRLSIPRISSNISIIRLPTVPHRCPPPRHCTIMSQPCHPALVRPMSTASCRSFRQVTSSNSTAHLPPTWPPNRQFQKCSTTCTSRQRRRRRLYIPLPVPAFYLTRLQLPSIVMLPICRLLNRYTIITLINRLQVRIHMALPSPTMLWLVLHHSISRARILGVDEIRGPYPRIQLDPPEVLRDPQHL